MHFVGGVVAGPLPIGWSASQIGNQAMATCTRFQCILGAGYRSPSRHSVLWYRTKWIFCVLKTDQSFSTKELTTLQQSDVGWQYCALCSDWLSNRNQQNCTSSIDDDQSKSNDECSACWWDSKPAANALLTLSQWRPGIPIVMWRQVDWWRTFSHGFYHWAVFTFSIYTSYFSLVAVMRYFNLSRPCCSLGHGVACSSSIEPFNVSKYEDNGILWWMTSHGSAI